MKINQLFLLAGAACLSLAGCSKSESEDTAAANLEVRLMDAPGDFAAVVLDVRQIEIHRKDDGDPDGWKFLSFKAQALNVLEYVNGRSALLVSEELEPGDLKEIRLVLGPDSYVITRDGERYDLKTPSGQSSGIKLKLDKATLRQRDTYQLLLDFDVARSIVERGNWKPGNDKKERYLLKPVIRVVAQDLPGSIRGTVTPAAARPQVLAIRASVLGPDTLSTMADASGTYQFNNLPSGTYRLEFYPTTLMVGGLSYRTAVRTGVIVGTQVNTIGVVDLKN